jgi:hypothetical protein
MNFMKRSLVIIVAAACATIFIARFVVKHQATQEIKNSDEAIASEYVNPFPEVPAGEFSSDGWPIDFTFSKHEVPIIDELDRSDYRAVYIDSEKYLRATIDGSIQISRDGGITWQTFETDELTTENFVYWMARHEAPGMTGYSVKDMADRLENGAGICRAAFSDGNELYFVRDEKGVYIIPYMPNKIASMWIDGQRMSITSVSHPYFISDKMVRSFYDLLVSVGITSREKAEADYKDRMLTLKKHGDPAAGPPLITIVED